VKVPAGWGVGGGGGGRGGGLGVGGWSSDFLPAAAKLADVSVNMDPIGNRGIAG